MAVSSLRDTKISATMRTIQSLNSAHAAGCFHYSESPERLVIIFQRLASDHHDHCVMMASPVPLWRRHGPLQVDSGPGRIDPVGLFFVQRSVTVLALARHSVIGHSAAVDISWSIAKLRSALLNSHWQPELSFVPVQHWQSLLAPGYYRWRITESST